MRQLQGRGPEPEIGDKIIGLDNHWDNVSPEGNALTNGAIGSIGTYSRMVQDYPKTNRWLSTIPPTELMYTDFITDDGDTFEKIPIDYQCLLTGNPTLTPKQEALIAQHQKRIALSAYHNRAYWKDIPYHFNYGYAITCWKAQGSEYPYVLGYDCSWLKCKNKDEYIKYLYTLVTRAS